MLLKCELWGQWDRGGDPGMLRLDNIIKVHPSSCQITQERSREDNNIRLEYVVIMASLYLPELHHNTGTHSDLYTDSMMYPRVTFQSLTHDIQTVFVPSNL